MSTDFAPKPTVTAGGIPVVSQRLAVSGSAVSFASVFYANPAANTSTNLVIVDVQGNDMYVTFDGSTPSSTNGNQIYAGNSYAWHVTTASQAKFIQQSAAGTVQANEFVSILGSTQLPTVDVLKPKPYNGGAGLFSSLTVTGTSNLNGAVTMGSTLSVAGTVTWGSTSGGVLAMSQNAGNNAAYLQFQNTGGFNYFGVNNSTGSTLAGTANALVAYGAAEFDVVAAGTVAAKFLSGGITIPGTSALNGTTTVGVGGSAAVAQLNVNGGSGTSQGAFVAFQQAGANIGYIGTKSAVIGGTSNNDYYVRAPSGQLVLQSNSSTALTLDTSQNATFVGAITIATAAAGVISFVPGSSNAYIGNSVATSLILRTTVSTAQDTNVLTLTGLNATFAGSITDAGSTNGAAAWKHGPVRTGAGLIISTTQGLQVNVAGTTYTLAVLSTNP